MDQGPAPDRLVPDDPEALSLVINEVRVKGTGDDWVELSLRGEGRLSLDGFTLSDRLEAPDRRIPFPEDLELTSESYLLLELSKEGWPGFAFSPNELCAIWDAEGRLVEYVEWVAEEVIEEGSYGRAPDLEGDFRWSATPSPGEANPASGADE